MLVAEIQPGICEPSQTESSGENENINKKITG